MAIEDFVALDQIDPVYFDRPYLVSPDTAGEAARTPAKRAARSAPKSQRERGSSKTRTKSKSARGAKPKRKTASGKASEKAGGKATSKRASDKASGSRGASARRESA